ncbi:MAG: hypothetical protein U1F43_34310 [Myxococcota bacterium]
MLRGGAGGLSAADTALLGAFREAWAGDPKGALEGLVDVIDRSGRRPPASRERSRCSKA